MIKKILSLLFILSFYNHSFSQQIYSALEHDKGFEVRENSKIKEVITDITFFNQNSTRTQKNITTLNVKNKILTELRYDNEGILTDKLFFQYDSTNMKCIASKYERWHKVIGYTAEITIFDYDANGYLVKITTTDQFKKLLRQTTLKNNEKGLPIELILETNSGEDFGKETAEYDYAKNIAYTKVLDKYGNELSKSEHKINSSIPYKGDVLNAFGDLLKSTIWEFEYTYDINHNWTKQVRYRLVDGKRMPNAEFKRKIKYMKAA
jgi:YD repeat-containing protein